MPKLLIDTNVLVYLFAGEEPVKQAKAIELFSNPEFVAASCVSTQNLSEFFNSTTRGKLPLLASSKAASYVEDFGSRLTVYPMTLPIILEAAKGVIRHKFSFYDAQLWASAKLNQIPIILSEDFSTGSTIEGVSFVNPFAKDFDLNYWLS